MNTKGDNNRSVRETKAKIQQAFLELMKQKHYTKISVREVAERANINRSTFYLHYEDVYDLIEKIEDDLNGQIIEAVKQINREGYVPGRHPQHTGLFEVLNQNADICRVLMSDNGDIAFVRKLIHIVGKALLFQWEEINGGGCADDIDLYARYVAHGVVGIFFDNLCAGRKRTTQELGFFAGEVTNWIDETFVKDIEKK